LKRIIKYRNKKYSQVDLIGLTHQTGFLALILRMKSGFLVQKPGFFGLVRKSCLTCEYRGFKSGAWA
jgi:hypothetical protein